MFDGQVVAFTLNTRDGVNARSIEIQGMPGRFMPGV